MRQRVPRARLWTGGRASVEPLLDRERYVASGRGWSIEGLAALRLGRSRWGLGIGTM